MKRASVTEAKTNLSALIDGLKGGSPVLIVDRGRPVARLEWAGGDSAGEQDGRLLRLVREGVVRPRRKNPDASLFDSRPPAAASGASALAAFIDDRRQGR